MVKITRHPMYLLDKWAHLLHIPAKIQNPICDAFDDWLEDDDYVEEDCD